MTTPLVEIKAIRKEYGDVVAVAGVSFLTDGQKVKLLAP